MYQMGSRPSLWARRYIEANVSHVYLLASAWTSEESAVVHDSSPFTLRPSLHVRHVLHVLLVCSTALRVSIYLLGPMDPMQESAILLIHRVAASNAS